MATEHHEHSQHEELQQSPQQSREYSQHGEMRHGEGGDHSQMALDFRKKWLWVYALNVIFGVLTLFSPFTFGYAGTPMMGSDIISGALIVVIGTATLLSVRLDFLGRWSLAFIGLWLNFAPLVFWTKSPAAYLNGTTVGTLLIAFAVLVPMMPGMAHHMAMMKPGPDIPPGWSYTPSSWHQRGANHVAAGRGGCVVRAVPADRSTHAGDGAPRGG